MITPQNAPRPATVHVPYGQRDQDALSKALRAQAVADGQMKRLPSKVKLAAPRLDETAKILGALSRHGPANISRISSCANVSTSATRCIVSRLVAAGVIDNIGAGWNSKYSLAGMTA